MDMRTLIDLAAEAAGSKAALAREMNKQAPRISEWYRGEQKPDAHEIAFLARKAGLPVLQTVAEIEAQMDSRYSDIWREALGKLTAAGIAASVIGAVTLSPSQANAAQYADPAYNSPSVYYVNQRVRKRTYPSPLGIMPPRSGKPMSATGLQAQHFPLRWQLALPAPR